MAHHAFQGLQGSLDINKLCKTLTRFPNSVKEIIRDFEGDQAANDWENDLDLVNKTMIGMDILPAPIHWQPVTTDKEFEQNLRLLREQIKQEMIKAAIEAGRRRPEGNELDAPVEKRLRRELYLDDGEQDQEDEQLQREPSSTDTSSGQISNASEGSLERRRVEEANERGTMEECAPIL